VNAPLGEGAGVVGSDAGLTFTGQMIPSWRRLAPKIVVAGVLPVIGYSLLRPHVGSDATALAAVTLFPLTDIAIERLRHGRFEPIGLIALVGIVIGLTGAVALHGNDTLLKLRESVVTGAFGVVCLASLFWARPVMFYLAKAFVTAAEPEQGPAFDATWERPGVPGRFRLVTAVWAVGFIGEAVIRTVLALTLPTGRFLAIAPVVGWIVVGSLIAYSTRVVRAGEAEVAAVEAALASE
jgi:uncharacterized membrane protein